MCKVAVRCVQLCCVQWLYVVYSYVVLCCVQWLYVV